MANFEKKEDVKRELLKPSSILKKVIIRIDYSGIISIDDWMRQLLNLGLNQSFSNFIDKNNNSITLNLNNPEEIAKALSVPVSEIRKEPVKTFLNGTFAGRKDKVAMEITSNFTTFVVDCNEYTTINDYLEYINTYISELKKNQTYTKVHRIGIRKIAAIETSVYDQYKQFFEEDQFKSVSDIKGSSIIVSENTDRFINTYLGIKANLTRRIRSLRRVDGNLVYQFLLDIDGYVDDQIALDKDNIIANFNEYTSKINNFLFTLFVRAATLEYFKRNAK